MIFSFFFLSLWYLLLSCVIPIWWNHHIHKDWVLQGYSCPKQTCPSQASLYRDIPSKASWKKSPDFIMRHRWNIPNKQTFKKGSIIPSIDMTCEKRPVNLKFHSILENFWHYQKMLNMYIPHDYWFHAQIIPKHPHRRCMHDHLWHPSLPLMADSLPIFKKYLPQSFSDFKAKSAQINLGLESHLREKSSGCSWVGKKKVTYFCLTFEFFLRFLQCSSMT